MQRRLRRRTAGDRRRLVGQVGVHRDGARIELEGQDVAVERRQVDQRPVEGVPLRPGPARPLPLLELLQRPGPALGCAARVALAGGAPAERGGEGLPFHDVAALCQEVGLLLRGVDEGLGGVEGLADVADRPREGQHRLALAARLLVGRQATGPADVSLRSPGREGGQLRVDAVPVDEHAGDGRRGRSPQRHEPAARADRGQQVVGRGGAQQQDAVRRRLLHGLEQRVGGALLHPVRVLDQRDLPAPAGRGARRAADDLPRVGDGQVQPLGHDHRDVGVRAGERLVAGRAVPATAVGTLQRGREGPRRHRPSRTRRSGEQPGVRHPRALAAGNGLGRGLRRVGELRHDGVLPHERVEDAHTRSRGRTGTSGSTRAATTANTSSAVRAALTTR